MRVQVTDKPLTDVDADLLAVLIFETSPFRPMAVDSVSIDPGTGAAKAQRQRLDQTTSFPSGRPG